MMVKYSLIIPVFNEESVLGRCLASLESQTFRDFEIIIVDNNSTDRSAEIAKKYTDSIYREKKQGYIHAVNCGVRRSKGSYVASCDADSIYPAGWLSKVDREFSRDKEIIAVFGSIRLFDANIIINALSGPITDMYQLFSRVSGLENTCGSNFIIRKDMFLKAGGYDPDYISAGPDIVLGRKIKQLGKIKLQLGNSILTSARRFKKLGYIKTSLTYMGYWLRLRRGKTPRLKIKEYENYRQK